MYQREEFFQGLRIFGADFQNMRAVSCDGVALQHFRMLSDSLYKATITVGSVDLHENDCSDVKIEFLLLHGSIVIRYQFFFIMLFFASRISFETYISPFSSSILILSETEGTER